MHRVIQRELWFGVPMTLWLVQLPLFAEIIVSIAAESVGGLPYTTIFQDEAKTPSNRFECTKAIGEVSYHVE